MRSLLDDLRFTFRALSKTRGFTVSVVLSLALGIGANTTVFTLVSGFLLHRLYVANPDSLVAVHTVDPRNPGLLLHSYANYKDYRDENRVFSSLLLYTPVTVNLTGHGDPKILMAHLVSENYFSALGVNPVIGRGFVQDEAAAPIAVLSYGLWMRQFGGNPNITSQTISLNGRAYRIAGVAPKMFYGLNDLYAADIWVPMSMASTVYPYPALVEQRRALLFSVVGRLNPGVGPAQAQAAMQSIAADLERRFPRENEGRRIQLTPVLDAALPARTRSVVSNGGAVLLIASSLVLLIACGNVANLLLARGASRGKEISIRLALGASRARLVRQLLTESIVLALLGGAAGLLVARTARDAVWALRPPLFNHAGIELSLDRKVLLYTLTSSLLTGVIFGLVPALRSTRANLATDLKERTASAVQPGRWQLRSLLVSGQVAFSVVALIGACLFVRSVQNAMEIDPGFDAGRLGVVAFNVGDQGYSEMRGRQYQQSVQEIAASTPGVSAAALANDQPLRVSLARTVLLEAGGAQGRPTLTSLVTPGYFHTIGIPLLQGREFQASDTADAPRAAIVNEAAAAYFWPGQSAIGKRLSFFGDGKPAQVVGIARNANYQGVGEEPQALIYLSLVQYYFPSAVLYVRTEGDPEAVSAAVRKQVQAVDRNLLLQSESIGRTIRESLWVQRLLGGLLGVFGGLALVLAATGVYGVISYSVNQRVREFGVRMALGATATQLQTMIFTEGMRVIAFGVAAGLFIGAGAAAAVRGMLFAMSPFDAVTFLLVPSVLIMVASAACIAPAFRAARIPPSVALRDE